MSDDINVRTYVRTARKSYRCDGCGLRRIKVGDRYLLHVLFPKHEVSGGRFQRTPECIDCAVRYGRGHLLAKVEVTA